MKEESLVRGCNCSLMATDSDTINQDVENFIITGLEAKQGPFLVINFVPSDDDHTPYKFTIDDDNENVIKATFYTVIPDSDQLCTSFEYGFPLVLNYLKDNIKNPINNIVIRMPDDIGIKTTMKIVAKTNMISLVQKVPDIYAFFTAVNIYSLDMDTDNGTKKKKKKKKKGKK